MAGARGIDGVAVGVIGVGALLVWAGIKGASVAAILQDLIKGQAPSATNIKPIDSTPAAKATNPAQSLGQVVGSTAKGSLILQVAAAKKGQCYIFGAGHTGDPCASRCTDCSSYVSCVLSQVMGRRINLTTGGLASIGTAVPYAQRQPGDVIVWNGGTGGGHTGIIATVSGGGGTMWHNPCTGCGGVQLGKYPYAARTAASAIVRRV